MFRPWDAPIPNVNWTLRSHLAAAGVAVCAVAMALSLTFNASQASAEHVAAVKAAQIDRLALGYLDYTAKADGVRVAAEPTPRVKPARVNVEDFADNARFVLAGLKSFDFTQLTVAHLDADERRCLAEAIYYEARSERRAGQIAIADVVMNRVVSPLYPDTICGVVYQGSTRTTGCQFTFTCDGAMDHPVRPAAWRRSMELANAMLTGVRTSVTHHATHYHTAAINPYWAPSMTQTVRIGAHVFYRSPADNLVTASAASGS